MARSYGKKPRKTAARTAKGSGGDSTASKYKLRGKDDAWLDMREMQQGLIDIARDLGKYPDHRVKRADVYIRMVDGDGNEVLIDPKGEKTLYPYKSAADEFGV
jgi:hypothetical protein